MDRLNPWMFNLILLILPLFRTASSVMIKLFLKLNLGHAWGGEVLGANSIA
jgi:hypothetical protein